MAGVQDLHSDRRGGEARDQYTTDRRRRPLLSVVPPQRGVKHAWWRTALAQAAIPEQIRAARIVARPFMRQVRGVAGA